MKKIYSYIRNNGVGVFLRMATRLVVRKFVVSCSHKKFALSSEISKNEDENYRTLQQMVSRYKADQIRNIETKQYDLKHVGKCKIGEWIKGLHFSDRGDPVVSIIIPVYNNIKYTVECLQSIKKCTDRVHFEIIIVDDHSTDDTEKFLSKISGITYIRNIKNFGFGYSCNAGARSARGKYLLFLNNDTQVTADWLTGLVNTFDAFHNVGAVGAKIVFPDGRLQEAGCLINSDCSSAMIGCGDDPDLPRYNYIREVDYCSAVCLMIPSKIFFDHGCFDNKFSPAYCEDVDLCLRLKQSGLRIFYNPNIVVVHHLSVTSNSIDQKYKSQLVKKNKQKLSYRWQAAISDSNKIRLIAFYLPQFHPIPENDVWWGKGFTEWINVARAKPNFGGHYQPHVPSDLGFYDLRIEKIMQDQADLAILYNIFGFCYYYYWFKGKRLLEMPLERMLETGTPNFPFCLCWANENWTRSWDGQEEDILIDQKHSEDDDSAVIEDIIRYMMNSNYIRIDGRPVLLIYRVDLFPDIYKTSMLWRKICRTRGVGEIYLVAVESFDRAVRNEDPKKYGFDASVEFPPHQASLQPAKKFSEKKINKRYKGTVHDYRGLVCKYAMKKIPAYTRFRTVVPSWDNTARRQNDSYIFTHSTPGFYQAWLTYIINQTREQNIGDERIVFINAWNEWAEGAHLEPDQKFGHGYLEATRNSVKNFLS